MSDKKRLLNDLRVIDLRAELEKRNLDKSGVRSVLIQRLAKQLEEEGHDPATHTFELILPEGKTPSKRTRRAESTVELEAEETPAMEDMIVQDDAGEEEETEPSDAKASHDNGESTNKMEVEETKVNRKRESKIEDEATQPKKQCIKEDDTKGDINTDAEDSINLDIGDDELLNDESDTTAKIKKDEAEEESPAEPASAAPAPAALAPPEQHEDNSEAPATSNDNENDKDIKDEKDKDGESEKKEKKDDSKEGGARNLWVSGLSGDTRAKDLKQLCSKHGKVIGAKVVTNARTPGSRCYGYVTMASSQDAENCIKNLHRTELHGRMISVEKAKSEADSASRRAAPARLDRPDRPDRRASKDHHDDSKEKDEDKARRSTRSRERRRSPRDVLSFSKIMKERDVARARERSRAAREEERRRRAAEDALRERERRQRQEKHRLALEREKLRAEREKIEREKNELLRLERERHRVEREKLELERLELKRAQLRLEEERRKRSGYEGGAYRKPSPPPEPAYDRHKRAPPPVSHGAKPSSSRQFEAPPPPRFELAGGYERADKRDRERDYKRDYPRHVSSSNMKYPSNGNASDDPRQPLPPGTRPKEPGRSYESREGRSYRASPPAASKQDARWTAAQRYPDAPTAAKGSVPRASGSGGGGDGWAGESRYGYEARYQPAYQPPPPGAAYPDRYAPPRDYRKY